MSVIISMGKFTPVQIEYAIKDNLPRNATRVTAHIVVGTPGTMTDLIRRNVIDVSEVKVFVLDEADNMLDQDGLGDQTLRVKKCAMPFPSIKLFIFCSASFRVNLIFKLSSSLPLSPIMSALLPINSPPMLTKSSSKSKNLVLTILHNFTWIAKTRTRNTRSLSASTHCLQ